MHNQDNFITILDESEELDDYSNDDLYNIESWGADLSFRELLTMYSENELLKPEIQRKYVWDRSEASRFVESLLLGLPVPSIFLAKTTDERYLIIDGFQRIMTVNDYVVNRVFTKDGKSFRLSNSRRINPRWRGKSFDELSDAEQRRIRSTTIHAIVFQQKEPKNDDTSLFQIFERINTSGRTLMSQEIRNCVYQGSFNTLLIELNKNKVWRSLFGTADEDPRMKDMEFILRFFALADRNAIDYDVTSISLKKTLNDYMSKYANAESSVINRLSDKFLDTITYIYENIGQDAFFNISKQGKVIKKLHPTIFDSIMVATFNQAKSNRNALNGLAARRENLLKDQEYVLFTSVRTTNTDHIRGRISKAEEYLYGTSV